MSICFLFTQYIEPLKWVRRRPELMPADNVGQGRQPKPGTDNVGPRIIQVAAVPAMNYNYIMLHSLHRRS